MNKPRVKNVRAALLIVGIVCCNAVGTTSLLAQSKTPAKSGAKAQAQAEAAEEQPPAPAIDPLEQHKSVFEIRKEYSDPFFPKKAAPIVKSSGPSTAEPARDCFKDIFLRGVTGPEGKRLALINGQPLAEGETATFRTSQGAVKVQCVQIKETSVIIKADCSRETKELFLKRSF